MYESFQVKLSDLFISPLLFHFKTSSTYHFQIATLLNKSCEKVILAVHTKLSNGERIKWARTLIFLCFSQFLKIYFNESKHQHTSVGKMCGVIWIKLVEYILGPKRTMTESIYDISFNIHTEFLGKKIICNKQFLNWNNIMFW